MVMGALYGLVDDRPTLRLVEDARSDHQRALDAVDEALYGLHRPGALIAATEQAIDIGSAEIMAVHLSLGMTKKIAESWYRARLLEEGRLSLDKIDYEF